MRLGIDIDGCLANFQLGWSQIYERWYPGELDRSKLDQWDAIVAGTHFEKDADFWEWSDVANIWRQLPVMPGAQGGLWELRRQTRNNVKGGYPLHEFHFVTNRSRKTEMDTEGWIIEHFRFVRREFELIPKLHFLDNKSEAPVDVWIDDSPIVLAELRDAGKTAIKFNHPWNKGAPCTANASNWRGIVSIINNFAEALAE
jgi:5'(3')-deoxyribonucleotidase